MQGVAVVTGASGGVGAGAAPPPPPPGARGGGGGARGAPAPRRLAAEGFDVVVGARRQDRLRAVADEIGARALPLDVTDAASVAAFCAEVPECRILVNNAGGALGRDAFADADEDEWRGVYGADVPGGLRGTKALLPPPPAGAAPGGGGAPP